MNAELRTEKRNIYTFDAAEFKRALGITDPEAILQVGVNSVKNTVSVWMMSTVSEED